MADRKAAEEQFLERACSVYRHVACLPVPGKGRVFHREEGVWEVEVKWTQRDLERGKNIVFAKSQFVSASEEGRLKQLTSCTFQRDVTAM